MIFGSTSKNVHLLSLTMLVIAIYGLFGLNINFTLNNLILSTVSFYILNIIGVWMMLHRYYSHKSFEFKNITIENILLLISILSGRGSPLSWVYIHRQHHAYSDTEKDPHSPIVLGYKLFGFGHYVDMESEKMKIFMVKDLMSKQHLFIHKFYILIILCTIIPLSVYNFELFYFIYVVPTVCIHLSQNHFNYIGHKFGYTNFVTKDHSKNNIWLFPFILGEAWHNNHHAYPKKFTTKHRFYEFDPMNILIKVLCKKYNH